MARRDSASYDITARDRTRAGIQSAQRGFQALDASVSRLTSGYGILAAAATLAPAAIVKAQAGAVERLGQTAQTVGIAAESMQAFGAAASRAGVDAEGIYDTLAEMQLRLSEAARGGGEAKEALDELGLSAQDLLRLRPEEQFRVLSEALAGVASQADRISFADQLFAEDGKEVMRIFADDVDDARERFERLGIAITDVDTSAVTDMNRTLRGTGGLVSAAAKTFTSVLAPALTVIVSRTADSAEGLLAIRSASEIAADGFVTAVGLMGNGAEGLDNWFEVLKIGLQEMNLKAAELANSMEGTEESAARLAETERVLQSLKDNLSGQTGDDSFLTQLRQDVEDARTRAEEAGVAIAALREKNQTLVASGPSIGGSDGGGAAAGANAIAKAAENADRALERLAASLGKASSSAEAELQLRAINDFRRRYPEEAERALAAEVAAYAEREQRLAGIGTERIDIGVDLVGATNVDVLEADAARVRGAGAARDEVLAAAGGARASIDVGIEVTGATDVTALAEDGARVADALSDRDAVLERAAGRDIDIGGTVTADAAGAVADELGLGTDRLEAEVDRRGGAFDRLVTPRVVAGIDLTDGAAAAADALGLGTRALELQTRARDGVIAGIDGARVATTVGLEDGADGAAAAIAAGTDHLVDIASDRSARLDAVSDARVALGLAVDDDADAVARSIDDGTFAVERSGGRRDQVLAELSTSRVHAVVDLTDEADAAARTLGAGTDALAGALDGRAGALDGGRAARVVAGIELEDDTGAVIDELEAGRAAFEATITRRIRGFENLESQRLVVGIDLRDDADRAADEIGAGTRALNLETRVRGELLDSLGVGETVDASVGLVDNAVDVAAAVTTGTIGIRDAIGARSLALAGAGDASPPDVVLDFDVEFPEFDAGVQQIREAAAAEIAGLDEIARNFPAKAAEVADAKVLALAAADQKVADYRAEREQERERAEAPIRSGISTLIGELRSETADARAEYQEQVALIREYGALKGVAEEEVTQLLEAALQDRNARLAGIAEERSAQQQAEFQQTFDLAADAATSVLGLFEKQVDGEIAITDKMSAEEKKRAKEANARNRERFEENKRYQQGQAYINMLVGASQVLSDPTLSFGQQAFAITSVLATGAALVSQIRGATYGSGGTASVSGSSGAAGSGGSSGTPDTRLADSVAPAEAAPSAPVIIIAGDGTREIGQDEAERIVTRGLDAARRSRRVRWPGGAAPAVTQFEVERV